MRQLIHTLTQEIKMFSKGKVLRNLNQIQIHSQLHAHTSPRTLRERETLYLAKVCLFGIALL